MRNIVLFILALSLSQQAWAKRPQEECGAISKQAAIYMQQRQAGKKRQEMTFSTDGTRPISLKRIYKDIIVDAHNEKIIEDPQLRQIVINSFQEKWYRWCEDR